MATYLISVGLSIGQQRYPSALCVAEIEKRKTERRSTAHYLVRHLERIPAGTRYPAIAKRLADVLVYWLSGNRTPVV